MARLFGTERFLISKRLGNRGFLKVRQAENLQDFAHTTIALQFLPNDGDPHLCLAGILARAVEAFDPQVLFDPFEEQLHLPSALVQSGDRQCRRVEIV